MNILTKLAIFVPITTFGYVSLIPNVMLSDSYHLGYEIDPIGFSCADRGILASRLFILSGITGLLNNKYLPLKVPIAFFCLAIIFQLSAFIKIGKFHKKN